MIKVVVEGPSDEQLAVAVVRAAGHQVDKVVVKNGKTRLDPLLANYNRAARHAPWVVFRDSDTHCPVTLRAQLLRDIDPSPSFLLRIVHPMSEAWLLADRAGLARYFSVPPGRVPADPEILQNPKRTLLDLCAGSTSRAIRRDMVLPDGRTGPLYTATVNDFAASTWDVAAASAASDSLRRAVERISALP